DWRTSDLFSVPLCTHSATGVRVAYATYPADSTVAMSNGPGREQAIFDTSFSACWCTENANDVKVAAVNYIMNEGGMYRDDK
ncbi:MAG: hypothetical protein M1835_007238, partial [Candelina submexicana]